MAWFGTSYAANPNQVLDVVLRAAGPWTAWLPATMRSQDRPPPSDGSPTKTKIANKVRYDASQDVTAQGPGKHLSQ